MVIIDGAVGYLEDADGRRKEPSSSLGDDMVSDWVASGETKCVTRLILVTLSAGMVAVAVVS